VRLIEPQADAASQPYATAPEAFSPGPGEWLVVPHQHMFGSEELSGLAPAIAERTDPPALRLNMADAEALGLGAGAFAEIGLGSGSYRLPVVLAAELPGASRR